MPDDLSDERIYGDERRHKEKLAVLQKVAYLLEELVETPAVAPRVDVAPPDLSILETLRTEPVVFDPEAIANALARRLPPDSLPLVAETLAAVTKQLERLNKKVTGLSTMPSGGSSAHVIVDSGIISSIQQPVEIQNEIGNPIPVSGTVDATPNRFSQKTGRVHKNILGDNITASTTLHTVTTGKTLYITSLFLEVRNTDVTGPGRVRVRDDTTTRFPMSASTAVAGQLTPRAFAHMTFPEPLAFTTNLNLELVSGTTATNVVATGYEE